jgi:hypothetical protein
MNDGVGWLAAIAVLPIVGFFFGSGAKVLGDILCAVGFAIPLLATFVVGWVTISGLERVVARRERRWRP